MPGLNHNIRKPFLGDGGNLNPEKVFLFMTYTEKLQDPRWQKKRLEVFERDNFTCKLCEDKATTLNVHHSKYFKEPWDAELSDLKTLCKTCHTIVEHGKKNGYVVIHIEKTRTYCHVFIFDGNEYSILFFEIEKDIPQYVTGFLKSKIDRFYTILNSL